MFDAAYPRNIHAAQGRVRVEYTDPLTGEVRERIDGQNHAFSQCFNICMLQRRLLRYCPMVISDWTGEIDYAMPIIPGNKIGYGIPAYGSSGDYRGAYRSADSFYDNIVDSGANGAESTYKYVYDFTPAQIPGDIKVIGLSVQDLNMTSNACSELLRQTCDRPFSYSNYTNYYGLIGPHYEYRYGYLYLSSSSPSFYLTLVYPVTDTFQGLSETATVHLESMLESCPSYYSGGISFMAYNVDSDTVVVGVYWNNSSSTTNRTYFLDVYEFNEDLTQRISFQRYENSSLNMYLDTQYCVMHGGYLYRFYKTDVLKYDLSGMGAATTWSDVLVKTMPLPTRYGTVSSVPTSSWNTRLNVLNAKYVVCTINADSPVLDLESDTVYGSVSESASYMWATDNIAYMNGLPILATRRTTMSGSSDYHYQLSNVYGNELMSAITLYKMPSDAPERPAGYGVTISYELKIQWE